MGTVLRTVPLVAPLVGITGRTSLGAVLAPGGLHLSDSPVDWFFGEYASRVREAGGLPIELPMIEYQYKDNRIWGATAMIISLLCDRLVGEIR